MSTLNIFLMFGHLLQFQFGLKSCQAQNTRPTVLRDMLRSPPAWLRRWHHVMNRLRVFIDLVHKSVLMYAATSLRHSVRDSILRHFMLPSMATTMRSTMAALTVQSSLNLDKYQTT